MTDPERIAKLEEAVSNLDREIEAIKDEQAATRMRMEKSAIDAEGLKNQLTTLTTALQEHQGWHLANSEKKYKITDIVLAVGMLAIAFMEFMKH